MFSTNSNSNLPLVSSTKLFSMVRGHHNLGSPIGYTPDVPSVTPFAVGAGPAPYDDTGYQELALTTQAFGPIPSGLGVSERGDVIQVQTSALQGPLNGGTY